MLATRSTCTLLRGGSRCVVGANTATATASTSVATSTSSRTIMTSAAARMAQRLASQGALLRVTGGVVLVSTTAAAAAASSSTSEGGYPSLVPPKQLQQHWNHFFPSAAVTLFSEEDDAEAPEPSDDGNSDDTSNNDNDNNSNGAAVMATSADDDSLWNRLFGSPKKVEEKSAAPTEDMKSEDEEETTDDTCHGGPGKKVVVQLEEELVESLPVMSLAEVQKCTSAKRMLATYQGIVYDVTSFVEQHPGGAELVKTAAGLDLEHFFANYTVHGRTSKAAEWLAPLAVGKLSPEEVMQARDSTTSEEHVRRRQQILKQKRRKIILVASTLPVWMTLRGIIGWIGFFIPPLGRLLAWAMPVTVPGLTKGSEPLKDAEKAKEKDEPYKVAVIGGGIAGCGAFLLARVTRVEYRADPI